MDDLPSTDELVGIIIETVRRNGFREDVYIRPSFYKSTKAIGVRLHHLEHELYVIATPFGNYIDIEKGVRVMTSSWRRNADEALPARGKIVGGYVNMAFQKSEAELNGFDEALVLTPDGHASEGSAANLFVVRDGVAPDAAGVGRHPRGRHPQGDRPAGRRRGHPDRGPLDRPLRAVRRATRCSCAARASRSARSSRSTIARWARARSGRSPARSASATSPPCAATCREYRDWLTPIGSSAREPGRGRRAGAGRVGRGVRTGDRGAAGPARPCRS